MDISDQYVSTIDMKKGQATLKINFADNMMLIIILQYMLYMVILYEPKGTSGQLDVLVQSTSQELGCPVYWVTMMMPF